MLKEKENARTRKMVGMVVGENNKLRVKERAKMRTVKIRGDFVLG